MKSSKHVFLAFLILAVVGLIGGCAPLDVVLGQEGAGAPAANLDLDGTAWTLVAIDGERIAADREGTLDFAGGEVSGVAFCNSFAGAYEQDGTKLSIGMLMSTLMACPDAGAETGYLAALADVVGARLDGDTLVLTNATGDDILSFSAAQHTSLEGTTWQLTGYNTGTGISSLVPESRITAALTDGTIEGTAGCNNYFASYTLDGAKIEVGPVANTEMFCLNPAGVMDQEPIYLQSLAAAASYKISRSTLTILGADGELLLIYAVLTD